MLKRKVQENVNTNGNWGWMIVMGAFLVNFTILGLLRSGSVIYVALIEAFHVSREEASWPFTLSGALMFIIGPLAAFLSHYFSIRQIVLFGVTVGAISVSLCYFANDIISVIILYGGLQGFGMGLMYTLNPVIINQYFSQRKATAMGIAYAGASLGSFALPPAVEMLLDYYGLRGCFLILGGLTLNAVVGASLFRPLKFSIADKLSAFNSQKIKEEGVKLVEEKKNHVLSINAIYVSQKMDDSGANENTEEQEDDSLIQQKNQTNNLLNQSTVITVSTNGGSCKNSSHHNQMMNQSIIRRMSIDAKHGAMQNLRLVSETVTHPLFIILCLTMTSYFLSSFTYLMVIVDYAFDRGIAETDSVYFVSIYSITDLFGRLTMGWVSDLPSISRRHVVLIATLGLGIMMEALTFTWSYIGMAVVSAFFGIFSGCLLINYPSLMAEILGTEKLATAMGFSGLVCGCVGLSRPFLIGYFRDTFGVYDNMFHTFAAILLFCSLLWILEPTARWLSKKWLKKKSSDLNVNL